MRQPTCLPLPMRAEAVPELEAKPVTGAAKANAPSSTTTIVEVAIISRITHNRYVQGRSRTHSTINNSRPHGSSSSGDIRSRSSGDIRSISSAILGSAGLDHQLNSSIGVERPTSGDINIGEEMSRISTSRSCANAAVRRSTSRQSTGPLGTCLHQQRRTIRIQRHVQELMSHSMVSAPSLMDIVRIQQWTLDRFELRASAAPSHLCTCAADAITVHTPRTATTGASLGL